MILTKKIRKKAIVLSVMNNKGTTFKIGDTVQGIGYKFKISAFRTDTPMPNWVTTQNIVDLTYWIMARDGKKNHWVNINMLKKVPKIKKK